MSDNQAVANQSAPQAGLPVTASLRPLLLLVGLAAAVAAGVGIALWSQAPLAMVRILLPSRRSGRDEN
jgi:hypothetical protein